MLHEAHEVIPNTLVDCQFDMGVENRNILLSIHIIIYLQWHIELDELKTWNSQFKVSLRYSKDMQNEDTLWK